MTKWIAWGRDESVVKDPHAGHTMINRAWFLRVGSHRFSIVRQYETAHVSVEGDA